MKQFKTQRVIIIRFAMAPVSIHTPCSLPAGPIWIMINAFNLQLKTELSGTE
uniref:Uncharacterized protein n=1 Tax=Anguilla anguilla TaxID=7936 RepID=A0A0E9X7Q7_ANGAN